MLYSDLKVSTGQQGQRGMILILAVLMLGLFAALSSAFFLVVRSNNSAANYFNKGLELRRYAESGINLAVYELTNKVQGGDGDIGTENWMPCSADDRGADGIPVPGDPHTAAVSVGPTGAGIRLLVKCTDSAWPNVKHIVSTAANADRSATVEVYVKGQPAAGAALGAAYVEGGAKFNLSGPFQIDGTDHNPDGTLGPMPAIPAIATSTGFEKVFKTSLKKFAAQIKGLGGNLSIKEFPKPDFDTEFNTWKPKATRILTGGSYASVLWGNWVKNDYQVTYCKSDLAVSSGLISGVVLVEGKLTLSGPTRVVGLVLVKGSVVFSGGGATKVYGSLWSKKPVDYKMSGDSGVVYSSKAIAGVNGLGGGGDYEVIYWNYHN